MVYESDFYTTRRAYSRPTISSYSVSKHEIPWEKVPYVPRPSLVADPITAFGKRRPKCEERTSILDRINREGIKPSAEVLASPIKQYMSARDETRSRVLSAVRRHADIVNGGGSMAAITSKDSMDVILPRLHQTTAHKQPHRRTPRYYTVTDTPATRPTRADQHYEYQYKSERSSDSGSGRPQTYSSTIERNSRSGPGGYNYTTERTSTTGGGPGGYSYSSTTSGRLPYGTNYRHYSYRV